MNRILILTLSAGLLVQGCTIVTEIPGDVVKIEGARQVGVQTAGPVVVAIVDPESIVESGVLEVLLTQRVIPVYEADRVHFQKIRAIETTDPLGAFFFVTLVAVTVVVVVVIAVAMADAMDDMPAMPKAFAHAMAFEMMEGTVHLHSMRVRSERKVGDRSWVNNLWYYDPKFELVPGETVVVPDVKYVGAKSEIRSAPVEGERIVCEIWKGGELWRTYRSSSDSDGRVRIGLVEAAKQAEGRPVRLKVFRDGEKEGEPAVHLLSEEDVAAMGERE